MPVTPEQAQMLAALACAVRPYGAPSWDPAGVVANIAKVKERGLADVAMAVLRAACDREAKSPGVIPTAGPHWNERLTEPMTPRPEKLDRHERCTICSLSEPACRIRWAADHEFTTIADIAKDDFDPAALLADVKTTVAAAKLAPEPERPGLAEVVENSPRVAALKAEMAAAREALAQDREAATVAAEGDV